VIEDLYRTAGHLVRRAHQIHDTIFAEETAGYDITSPQFAALRAVAEFPEIEQTALSDTIAYDRSTIGGLIDRLEAKGMLRRTIGTRDRRTKRLSLTPAGATLLSALGSKTPRVQERLLAPLSPEERATFLHLLERIVDLERAGVRASHRRPRNAGAA
jgi:MarR family transcriptional regulator, lower aerobic nicotinate degradation pathway regulator